MTIGERIKIQRMEHGWTQRDLAQKMGYSNHSAIVRIEAGKTDLPQSRIVQFAEIFGVTTSYLMGWEDGQKNENPANEDGISDDRRALMQFVQTVPEDKAAMILRVMKSILENS